MEVPSAERLRERLTEESLLWTTGYQGMFQLQASRNRWVVPMQYNNLGKSGHHHFITPKCTPVHITFALSPETDIIVREFSLV